MQSFAQTACNQTISGIGKLSTPNILTGYLLENLIPGNFHDKHDEPHRGKSPVRRFDQEYPEAYKNTSDNPSFNEVCRNLLTNS